MTDIDTEHTRRGRGRPVGTTRKTLAEIAQTQREASSRWYYNNHEYRCNQKKKYYEANRDRILEQRKQKKILFNKYIIFFDILIIQSSSSRSCFWFCFCFCFSFSFCTNLYLSKASRIYRSPAMCSFIFFCSSCSLCLIRWVNL